MTAVQTSQVLDLDQRDLTVKITPIMRECLLKTGSFQIEATLKVLVDRNRPEVTIWNDNVHKVVYRANSQQIAPERMVTGLSDTKIGARVHHAVQQFGLEIKQGMKLLDQLDHNCILFNFKFKDCRLVGVSWELNRKIVFQDKTLG